MHLRFGSLILALAALAPACATTTTRGVEARVPARATASARPARTYMVGLTGL